MKNEINFVKKIDKIFLAYFIIFLVLFTLSEQKKKRSEKENIYEYYENFNLTEEMEREYQQNNEVYKNAEKVENKKVPGKEDEEFNRWEEKIRNFQPENLLTVNIKKKDYFAFFQEVTVVPAILVCAFYVHDEESKIDFEVYGEDQKLLQRIRAKNRDFYEFNVTTPSTFEFHLNNERVNFELF